MIIKHTTASAPTRVDLAGGTLDLWPTHSLVSLRRSCKYIPFQTIHIALDLKVYCDIKITAASAFHWCFVDKQLNLELQGNEQALYDMSTGFLLQKAAVIAHLEHLTRAPLFLHISTHSDVPRGSGLGASSALLVCLLWALEEVVSEDGDRSAQLKNVALKAQHWEAGVLGTALAGNQDHFAAAFGNLQTVVQTDEGAFPEKLACSGAQLLKHFVLVHAQEQHVSFVQNTSLIQGLFENDDKTLTAFYEIAKITEHLRHVLMKKELTLRDMKEVAQYMSLDWELRKAVMPSLSTPSLEHLYHIALRTGALGGKVCGAAGGGVLAMVTEDPDHKQRVEEALRAHGGHVLKAGFSPSGVHKEQH